MLFLLISQCLSIRLKLEESTFARRFITLVDAMYEHKCKFICVAEDVPEKLYPNEEEAAIEEVFAFQRACSRLQEMQTKAYLLEAHRE